MNDSYILNFNKKTSEIYIENEKDIIILNQKITQTLLRAIQSSRFKSMGHQLIYLDDIYFYIITNDNKIPVLTKVNSQNGKYEKIESSSISPRVMADYMYYLQLPTERNEKALLNSGLIRLNLKTGEKTLLMSAMTSMEIGFNSHNYVPISESEIIFQEGMGGNRSKLIIADLTNVKKYEELSKELIFTETQLKSYQKEMLNNYDASEDKNSKSGAVEIDPKIKEYKEKINLLKKNKKQKKTELTLKYFVSDGYMLMQNPVNNQPLFFHENPQWPILSMKDVIKRR